MQRHAPKVAVADWDGVPVIQVSGEIDLASVPELRAVVNEVTGRSPKLLLFDFREVRYLDSSGLGILISAKRRLAEYGGEVVVVAGTHAVQRALSLSCLDRIIAVYRDEASYRAARRGASLAS